MTKKRPVYIALNEAGKEFSRPAQLIRELPTPMERAFALKEATESIGKSLGLSASKVISYGEPIYKAFMSAPVAKKHQSWEFLSTIGENLSLDHCASFN